MYCILVSGIPAAGKTFYANYLASDLSIPIISKDQIKELLFDAVGYRSREEKMRINELSTEIMCFFAKQLMESNKAFILESNFEIRSKDGINKLLTQFDYIGITINLVGDYKIMYKRFLERNRSADRHPGHIVNDYYPRTVTEIDYEQVTYSQYVSEIQNRGMDKFDIGISLRFDTTDIDNFEWEMATRQVRKVLMEQGEL